MNKPELPIVKIKLELLSDWAKEGVIHKEVSIKKQEEIIDNFLKYLDDNQDIILNKYFTTNDANVINHREALKILESYKYDAFISYRRVNPDKQFAHKLLKDLEAEGYKVAIDERDFMPNEPFLLEMERCIKESRFTLAIVSPRFFESGNTEQEGIIAVVSDMRNRKRRLVPIIIEKSPMPNWIYILSGVDFTIGDPLISPFDRLKQCLIPHY